MNGVLAFGDSITNGGGELQWGVALQSWALWTARGLGLPYTPYAVDGARIDDVVAFQLPLFERVNSEPDARFELGTLYIGTNDIRFPDWDPARFSAGFEHGLAFLAQRCERLITGTLPLTVGRPPDPKRIAAANTVIESVAARHDALVLDLTDFRARNLMMADHIHPTAFGQIALAERALTLLAADGMDIKVHPSHLIPQEPPGRRERLRGDLTYSYRCLKYALAQRAQG
jgi:lysophospholipase L1-like esterase